MNEAPPELQTLFQHALSTRLRAHVPYSEHRVGAAIRTADGSIFTGCNVENASFGATLCAERTAIVKAVSEVGKFILKEVVVVTASNPPWPPCGLCRQVFVEFGHDVTIYIADLEGKYDKYTLEELFPHAFREANLN